MNLTDIMTQGQFQFGLRLTRTRKQNLIWSTTGAQGNLKLSA